MRAHMAASLAVVVVLPTPVEPTMAKMPPCSYSGGSDRSVRRLRSSTSISQRTDSAADSSSGMRSSTVRASDGE